MNINLVLSSIPVDKADSFAKKIIEKKKAACVHISPPGKSYFYWEGMLNNEEESLLFIKTSQEQLEDLLIFIEKEHPYTVPEILIMETKANKDYAKWVQETTKKDGL